MKKSIILLVLILFNINLSAQQIQAKYTITYGSYFDLGVATATINIDKDNYKIRMEAQTTGLARALTNNRVEIYESSGKIINNLYVPHKFIKIKKDDLKKRVRDYTFLYDKRKVLVTSINSGKKKVLTNELKYEFKDFYNKNDGEMKFFAKNDLLSLFFNINKKLKDFVDNKEYTQKVVGANKQNGKVDILIPTTQKLNELENILENSDEQKLIVYINQRIFGSKRGELFISLNDAGFCSKAVLKDVLFFGDIVGEMKEFKVTKG